MPVPTTSLKQEIIEMTSSPVKFYHEFVEKLDEYMLIKKNGKKAIAAKEFYEKYKSWCEQNNGHEKAMTTFGISLREIAEKDKISGKIYYLFD